MLHHETEQMLACKSPKLSKVQSVASGTFVEDMFCIESQRRGFQPFGTYVDNGIDFMNLYVDEDGNKVELCVQVTSAKAKKTSVEKGKGTTYQVTKPAKKIRSTVDVIVVGGSYDYHDEPNINNGRYGLQDIWFIIPVGVYRDKRMAKNYKINTETGVWNFNVRKEYKPPLDKAFNSFHFLRYTKEQLEDQTFIDSFFPKKTVTTK